jgi:tetratricopeptide (TPR) repeat protein
MKGRSTSTVALCAFVLCGCGALVEAEAPGKQAAEAAAPGKQAAEKIPITTSSAQAKALYLEGRDLADKLRFTDAHRRYEKAVATDQNFALARLGVAITSANGKEVFDELAKAVALADKVSEGERLLIRAADAAERGDPAQQKAFIVELTKLHPNDERAHHQLGVHYFNVQNWAAAVAAFEKAVRVNPGFSPSYNLLGYAYRFLEAYPKAEETFKKYIQLIPDDPNPYDSYAELLMKMGRFDESIANYEKALKLDRNFVASYVGIGNNQTFMGRGAEARKTYARLAGVARNAEEKRRALFWTASSYIHEGATDEAIAEVEKMLAIALEGGDFGAAGGDHNLIGNILLEAGKPDEAAARFRKQLETVERATLPADVKEQARRNGLFDDARVALAKNDLATAKVRAQEYAGKVSARKVPFEVWQSHEIAGYIALAEKKYTIAVAELRKANEQDPRVLYYLAVALRASGNSAEAAEVAGKAAKFNGLGETYAFVRRKAMDMAAKG